MDYHRLFLEYHPDYPQLYDFPKHVFWKCRSGDSLTAPCLLVLLGTAGGGSEHKAVSTYREANEELGIAFK